MNFKERIIALELEMTHARSAGDTEKLRGLEVQHDEMTVAMWDEAYVRACELDSPNSPEFDALQESIYRELSS